MCGLTGFIGPYAPERVAAMNSLVAHRGPDDEGLWADAEAGVALGHRRLAIIDLSPEGRQPMMLGYRQQWISLLRNAARILAQSCSSTSAWMPTFLK